MHPAGATVLARPQQGYPPAGTYPPPPEPEPEAFTQMMISPAVAGMPAITVNTTSLTGNANTVVGVTPGGPPATVAGQKGKVLTFFLCFFFGFLGVHRFYTGKVGTGVLWMLTGGMFFFGWLVDTISILAGSFRDANGYLLQI